MYDDDRLERFREFHYANPEVYRRLSQMTWDAYHNGRRKIGIKMLLEVLRWEHTLSTKHDDFKINNNYAPYYARLIMRRNPELGDIFNLREMQDQ